MSPRLISAPPTKLCSLTAALLFAMVALSAGLSAAPQLHEWLHDGGDRSHHECAATLMSSGSVECAPADQVSALANTAPALDVLRTEQFLRIFGRLDFTRLEHAPPAFS